MSLHIDGLFHDVLRLPHALLRGMSHVTLKLVDHRFSAYSAGRGALACPNAIPAKQRMPNTQNVIFIEIASDLEESRIKERGDGLEFLLPNSTRTICKPHTKA